MGNEFGFCPKCGALMQSGQCQSCGYGKRVGASSPSPNGATGAYRAGQPTASPNVQVVRQPKKKNSKRVIVLSVVLACILLLGLFAASIFYAVKMADSTLGVFEGSEMPFQDEYGDYGDDYEYYEPSPNDAYYEEFVDATRNDLDYQIWWASDSMNPDDYESELSYYTTYPVLMPSEGAHGNYDRINEMLKEAGLHYKNVFQNYSGGTNSYAYVTYMDEDKISVCFQHQLYEGNIYLPVIQMWTFDVKTGKEIPVEEMFTADLELAMRVRTQDKNQNGGTKYIQDLSDEELLEILKDPQQVGACYTPVGLEIGFNYQSQDGNMGWVTVTIKEQAL